MSNIVCAHPLHILQYTNDWVSENVHNFCRQSTMTQDYKGNRNNLSFARMASKSNLLSHVHPKQPSKLPFLLALLCKIAVSCRYSVAHAKTCTPSAAEAIVRPGRSAVPAPRKAAPARRAVLGRLRDISGRKGVKKAKQVGSGL